MHARGTVTEMDRSISRRMAAFCAPFAAGLSVALILMLASRGRPDLPDFRYIGEPRGAMRLQGSKLMVVHDKGLDGDPAASTPPSYSNNSGANLEPAQHSAYSQQPPGAAPTPQYKHCSRVVPLRGVWDKSHKDLKKWSFSAISCDTRPVARADARSCLAGRKVFGLGNSIVRQFVFELTGVTDAAAVVPRLDQLGICSKGGAGVPQRCMHAFGNGSEGYAAWFMFFNGWPGTAPAMRDSILPGRPEDTCGSTPLRECLRVLLAGARPSDIVLTNVAISYGLWDPPGIEDIRSWRQEEARVYIRTLSEMFPGTIIYMPQSPMQSSPSKLEFPNRYMYERVERANEHILPVIMQESNWMVFDIWSLMKPVLYTKLYNDPLHFEGKATQIGWDILLRMICPDLP